jgi:hypothetical protein
MKVTLEIVPERQRATGVDPAEQAVVLPATKPDLEENAQPTCEAKLQLSAACAPRQALSAMKERASEVHLSFSRLITIDVSDALTDEWLGHCRPANLRGRHRRPTERRGQ